MICLGLVESQQQRLARRIRCRGARRIACGLITDNLSLDFASDGNSCVDVKKPVGCVIRMKSQSQQALFASLRQSADLEKGNRTNISRRQIDDADSSGVLFQDEQTPGISRR